MKNKKQRPLPDFIGIGAQRCGTSWLYRRLGEHPELWLPPIKEIHFFNDLRDDVSLHREKIQKDLRHRYRAYASPKAVPKVKQPNLAWDFNYFLRPKSISWYKSLFVQGVGKVAGEITPAYMMLSKDVVEKIYALNSKLKIIFVMRDPVDRVWSAAVRSFITNHERRLNDVSEEEIINFARKRGTVLRTDYLRTLSVWESFFPAEQLHIDFFDNIQENPEEVLVRIFNFLGVEESTKYMLVDLRKKIASSTQKAKIEIPNALSYEVCAQNIEQLEKLSERFGGHTSKWLAKAEKALKSNNGEF